MKKAAIGLLGLALAAPASAWHTGLITIPIADILGHREFYGYYSATGFERHIDKKVYSGAGIQVGIFDRLEVGYDTDFEGWKAVNAKLLLVEPKDGKYAISVGFRNWERSWSESYLVGRYDLQNVRLHGGWIEMDRDYWFMGADFAIGEATGLIEWMSGRDNYLWAGIDFPIPALSGVTLTAAFGVPNTRSNGNSWTLSLNYGFRL